jgi:hypothetical protein
MVGRLLMVVEAKIAGLVIPSCQELRTLDWQGLGYVVRSRRPSLRLGCSPNRRLKRKEVEDD